MLNMGSYIPSTLKEREEMLAAIGLRSLDELYGAVPKEVLITKPLNLPEAKSEMSVRVEMEKLAAKNVVFPHIFRGAGAYKHYIPSIVKYVPAKEEFVTAYTPYQAEISQGILQSIFEYQTEMCELTGMDVSNASVYDGATAAAEAVSMCRDNKRTKALVSGAAAQDTIDVIATYCAGANAEMVVVPAKNGVTDIDALKSMLDDKTACFYVQQPNFYGNFEDCTELGEIAHAAGAKYIMGCNPIALGIMKSPGECGADIATAEGQPLGMSLAFGGPYLGVMACTQKMMRKIPGRVVGETVDAKGERCYVLTLQAREQHIRREKSSSNICSNQALCALTASVYIAAMGEGGIRQVAEQCMSKAHYLADQLCKIDGFNMSFKGEYFHEFVTTCPVDACELMTKLESRGILGGLPIELDGKTQVLWCATEMNTKEDIDFLVKSIREVMAK